MLKDLGEGSFAKVKLCIKNETDELFVILVHLAHRSTQALKVFDKGLLKKRREFVQGVKNEGGGMAYKDALQDVLREIEIMKRLNHVNIIRLHEIMDDAKEEKLYIGRLVLSYKASDRLRRPRTGHGLGPKRAAVLSWHPWKEVFHRKGNSENNARHDKRTRLP